MLMFYLTVTMYLPTIYKAFNPAKDAYDSNLKNVAFVALSLAIPLSINVLIAKKYTLIFKKAMEWKG